MKHADVTRSPLALAIEAQQADAIFLSLLSAHIPHTATDLLAAIALTTDRCGGQEACESLCAAEYGAHPETAQPRMAWAHLCAQALALGQVLV